MSHDPGPITDPDTHVDPWFQHDPNEPHHMASHGKFNNMGIFVTLFLTAAGTFGVAILVILLVRPVINDMKVKYQDESVMVTQEKRALFSAWTDKLYGSPEWISEDKGVVSLPLGVATQRVLERYQQPGS